MGLRLGRGGAAHVYGTWVWRVAKVVQLLSLSSSRTWSTTRSSTTPVTRYPVDPEPDETRRKPLTDRRTTANTKSHK